MRKPALLIEETCFTNCEIECADKLRSNQIANQHLCFSYMDSTIPLLHDYRKIKANAIFIGRTPWFMSGIAVNSEERFSFDME